jgi:hypothetical protein
MATTIALVPANATVSSGFEVPRSGRFTVWADSMGATSVGLQFSDALDASSASYRTLFRDDGSGQTFTATSASAPAASGVIAAVGPVARLLLGATVNAVRSFQVMPVF